MGTVLTNPRRNVGHEKPDPDAFVYWESRRPEVPDRAPTLEHCHLAFAADVGSTFENARVGSTLELMRRWATLSAGLNLFEYEEHVHVAVEPCDEFFVRARVQILGHAKPVIYGNDGEAELD